MLNDLFLNNVMEIIRLESNELIQFSKVNINGDVLQEDNFALLQL